jgi:hypothetical protein
MSIIVKKTKKYKLLIMVGCFVAFLTESVFVLVMFTENIYYSYAISFLMGFFTTGIFPIVYDFGCEIAFPAGEAIITGTLIVGNKVVSIIEVNYN